jgi:hypothetical protein
MNTRLRQGNSGRRSFLVAPPNTDFFCLRHRVRTGVPCRSFPFTDGLQGTLWAFVIFRSPFRSPYRHSGIHGHRKVVWTRRQAQAVLFLLRRFHRQHCLFAQLRLNWFHGYRVAVGPALCTGCIALGGSWTACLHCWQHAPKERWLVAMIPH